jgi:hypothetical protein
MSCNMIPIYNTRFVQIYTPKISDLIRSHAVDLNSKINDVFSKFIGILRNYWSQPKMSGLFLSTVWDPFRSSVTTLILKNSLINYFRNINYFSVYIFDVHPPPLPRAY